MNFNTFIKRKQDYEEGKPLTEEQYSILMEQKEAFETLARSNYIKGVSQDWLEKVREIYIDHFKQPVNIKCPKCVATAMKQLNKKIQSYQSPKSKKNAKRSHKQS